MRTCTKCGASKAVEEFAWKNQSKGKRHSHCRDCQSGVSHSHYLANKEEYIDRAKTRYSEVRAQNEVLLQEYLAGKQCEICGEGDPRTLEFVHRNPKGKKDSVRRLISQPWDVISQEIQKCYLACANCCRRRKLKR